jgi:putative membrane protein
MPVIYDSLFGPELLHRVTHILILLGAVITWLPVLSPAPERLPRLSQPAQMLYCFVQSVPGALVGSLLSLADFVLYRHYLRGPLELGVSPVADQQLGGLLMWVIGGTFWLVAMTVIFFVWADREEARAYR